MLCFGCGCWLMCRLLGVCCYVCVWLVKYLMCCVFCRIWCVVGFLVLVRC